MLKNYKLFPKYLWDLGQNFAETVWWWNLTNTAPLVAVQLPAWSAATLDLAVSLHSTYVVTATVPQLARRNLCSGGKENTFTWNTLKCFWMSRKVISTSWFQPLNLLYNVVVFFIYYSISSWSCATNPWCTHKIKRRVRVSPWKYNTMFTSLCLPVRCAISGVSPGVLLAYSFLDLYLFCLSALEFVWSFGLFDYFFFCFDQ